MVTFSTDSNLIATRPKVYMRGSSVHIEGNGGPDDVLIISYNHVVLALAAMLQEQQALAREATARRRS